MSSFFFWVTINNSVLPTTIGPMRCEVGAFFALSGYVAVPWYWNRWVAEGSTHKLRWLKLGAGFPNIFCISPRSFLGVS